MATDTEIMDALAKGIEAGEWEYLTPRRKFATPEEIRKALHIRTDFTPEERWDLATIANRTEARHVANPRRRLSRVNALTVAMEVAREGRLSGTRVRDAIAWFADYEPEIHELAEGLTYCPQ